MGIAAGGRIEQTIVPDPVVHQWDSSQTKWFNVQILNSANFTRITGLPAPSTPANAQTYADHGYPFFEIWEEPSTVAGDFQNVQSVGQIDRVVEPRLRLRNVLRIGRFPFLRRRSGSSTTLTDATPPAASNGRVGNLGTVGLRGSSGNVPEVRFFQDATGMPTFRSIQEFERYIA